MNDIHVGDVCGTEAQLDSFHSDFAEVPIFFFFFQSSAPSSREKSGEVVTRSSVCQSWNEHLTTVGLKDHSSSHTHTHPEHVWHEGTSNVITQHLKGNVTSMRRRSPVDVWGTHWRRFIDTAHTSGLDWLERAVGQPSPDWWWLLQ